MNAQEKLTEKLKDKRWRITSWALYRIKDKEWKVVPFIPNEHQLDFYDNKEKHNLIIIPKARQLWFSTAEQVWMFDDFLFNKNRNCWIIADTKDVASTIFRDKIRLLRDYLPDVVEYQWIRLPFKKHFILNTNTSQELSIDNTGSRINVWVSYRGWTLQRLHISEFGKICNKYPEKAQEIVTGALQTVAIGQKITIESTAMGSDWYFFEFCQRAKEIQEKWREPWPLEWKLLFYPRHLEKWYAINSNVMIPQETINYFNELQEKGIMLSQEQKNRYTLKSFELWDNMFREYPSSFEEAFNQSLKGSYYERELMYTRKSNRICKVPYDHQLQVHTARDLWWAGGWDDTAIRFFQKYWNEIRVIDFREWNGRSLIEILETVIKTKPYQYWKFIWPHDMQVTEYSTGVDRYTTARKFWFTFEIVPRNDISDWINSVRQIFGRLWFDEEKTHKGIQLISKYTRAWDEKNQVYKDKPQHNWTSHAADALRYLAQYENTINQNNTQAEIYSPDWWFDG